MWASFFSKEEPTFVVEEFLSDRPLESFKRVEVVATSGSLDDNMVPSAKRWVCPKINLLLAAENSSQKTEIIRVQRLQKHGILKQKTFLPTITESARSSTFDAFQDSASSETSRKSFVTRSSSLDDCSEDSTTCNAQLLAAFREVALLLWHRSQIVQIAAAFLFTDCARSCPASRPIINECGSLATLIALLKSSEPDVQSAAVGAIIESMVECNLNKLFVLSSGFLALTSLLDSKRVDIQEAGLKAIAYSLENSDRRRAQIKSSKVMEIVIRFIKTPRSDSLTLMAIRALKEICHGNDENQDIAREQGLLRILINILMSTESRVLRQTSTSALMSLCHKNEQSILEFFRQGGVDALIGFMKRAADVDIPLVLEALAICCKKDLAGAVLMCNGGVVFILRYLHTGTYLQRLAALLALSRSIDINHACCHMSFQPKKTLSALKDFIDPGQDFCSNALSVLRDCLLANASLQQEPVVVELASKVVDTLKSRDVESILIALDIIAGFIQNDVASIITILKETGSLQRMTHFLDIIPYMPELEANCITCIALASADRECAQELGRFDIIHLATRCLKGRTPDVQCAAVQIIGNCSKFSVIKVDQLAFDHTLVCLFDLLQSGHYQLEFRVATTLSRMFTDPGSSLTVETDTSLVRCCEGLVIVMQKIRQLVQVISEAKSQSFQGPRTIADLKAPIPSFPLLLVLLRLANKLLDHDASRECVGRIEGIELICQILSDECNASWPIDIIYWCCRFLACGCLRSETNARAAFHSHIIPVLMRLTSHPHASVVTSSIFAIDRIAQHSGDACAFLAVEKDIEHLSGLLKRYKSNTEIITHVASTLGHIFECQDVQDISLGSQAGFQLLVHLLSADEPELLCQVLRLICSLTSRSDANRMFLMTENVTSSLSRLLNNPEMQVRHYSSLALDAFSMNESSDFSDEDEGDEDEDDTDVSHYRESSSVFSTDLSISTLNSFVVVANQSPATL